MKLLPQLVQFYYNYDRFQDDEHRLSEYEISNTIGVLLDKDRIRCVLDDYGQLLGYVESWRLNFEQWGRMVCHVKPFDVGLEDIETGPIAVVANVTIHPAYRSSHVIRELRHLFFEQNAGAKYLVGEALRKKTQPIKVFTADKVHYMKEVTLHG